MRRTATERKDSSGECAARRRWIAGQWWRGSRREPWRGSMRAFRIHRARSRQTPLPQTRIARNAAGHETYGSIPPSVSGTLEAPGKPLESATRTFMESRFGRDFSEVRVHADSKADDSARGIGARAYAAGNHIAFQAGEYAPATTEGRHLIAHELGPCRAERPR